MHTTPTLALVVLAVTVLCTGCSLLHTTAPYDADIAPIRRWTQDGAYDQALQELERLTARKHREAQGNDPWAVYQLPLLDLERATLLFMSGQHVEASERFEHVYQTLDRQSFAKPFGIRIGNNQFVHPGQPGGAYRPLNHEAQLLHTYAMLNYLKRDNVYSAAVEARRLIMLRKRQGEPPGLDLPALLGVVVLRAAGQPHNARALAATLDSASERAHWANAPPLKHDEGWLVVVAGLNLTPAVELEPQRLPALVKRLDMTYRRDLEREASSTSMWEELRKASSRDPLRAWGYWRMMFDARRKSGCGSVLYTPSPAAPSRPEHATVTLKGSTEPLRNTALDLNQLQQRWWDERHYAYFECMYLHQLNTCTNPARHSPQQPRRHERSTPDTRYWSLLPGSLRAFVVRVQAHSAYDVVVEGPNHTAHAVSVAVDPGTVRLVHARLHKR